MRKLFEMVDELRERLEDLRRLPFTTKAEGPEIFIYDVERQSGLDLKVDVVKGKHLVLQVSTYGHIYNYQENKSYFHGLVKTGKGDDIKVSYDAPWTLVSRGMTELTGDKRYMEVHKALKSSSMQKNFCGQYVGARNVEEFGYWDDVFGEIPLYLEAVTEWDVTSYLQTVGSMKDFVDSLSDVLCEVWGK